MANNRNCYNHTVYQAYDEFGNKDDRIHKYSFGSHGRVQFTCLQCASPWEDYQRFKKHCREVHGYDPWNYSDPNSKYQQDLRAVREMIDRVAAKRKAESAVGPNEMEPRTKSFKSVHSVIAGHVNNNTSSPSGGSGQVNNNPGDPGPSRVFYEDDYCAMIVREGSEKKAAMKKRTDN